MRLCIADPPYLGRAARWYGDAPPRGVIKADRHPHAAEWDDLERHRQLVWDLQAGFDGWAVAMPPDSLALYLREAPTAHVAVWVKPNACPSRAPVRTVWEAVLVAPLKRGQSVPDVLTCSVSPGFAGAKPPAWTRWVLDMLGYDPERDELVDMFPGSGAVSRAAAQGVLL